MYKYNTKSTLPCGRRREEICSIVSFFGSFFLASLALLAEENTQQMIFNEMEKCD